MFFVYILYSESHDSFYVWQTSDINNRLHLHNAKRVKSTARFAPWALEITIQKESRSEALILERKLKNLSKERLRKFIEKYS